MLATMIRASAYLLTLFLTPGLSAAAESVVVEGDALRVTITERQCQALVPHVPAPDVAYRPGTDAMGRPVAPADLPGGSRITLPDSFDIPITVDLADRYGIPADPALFDGEVRVGIVTLEDNRLYFNGQPLTPEDEQVVAAACRGVR
ncbi:hypothetical protein [Inquilinus sp. CAU 1745]|uniref:hypothetical protein n=1 Tax=Inquilinus sp. CAU 1745 TaxID=3140369 RepID=UPI00325B7140